MEWSIPTNNAITVHGQVLIQLNAEEIVPYQSAVMVSQIPTKIVIMVLPTVPTVPVVQHVERTVVMVSFKEVNIAMMDHSIPISLMLPVVPIVSPPDVVMVSLTPAEVNNATR